MTLEELRQTRTKRRLTAEERMAYCSFWQSSGLTKRSFCRREGIAPGTLISWLKGHEAAGAFIPVEVVRRKIIYEETSKELVLRLGNGLSISGRFSSKELPQWLKELSDALASICG